MKYFSGLFFMLLLISCGKDCIDTNYSFSTHTEVYPDKDSMMSGDTLWITTVIPTMLPDNESSKTVDYSGAENLGTAIRLLSLHGGSIDDTGADYALDSFHYYIVTGSLYTSDELAKNYLYDEVDNNYKFKLGIIGLKKGTYALSISDATNVYRREDKCTKASYYQTFANTTDQHLYLYQNSRLGYEISDYERTHMYCFKVY